MKTKNRINSVSFAPAAADLVFMWIIKLFFGPVCNEEHFSSQPEDGVRTPIHAHFCLGWGGGGGREGRGWVGRGKGFPTTSLVRVLRSSDTRGEKMASPMGDVLYTELN